MIPSFLPRKNRKRLEHERRRASYNQRRPDLRSGGRSASPVSPKTLLRATAICVVLAALVLGGKYLGDRLLLQNPHYQIRELVIETDGHIPRSEIIEIAGIEDATNLMLVAIGQIERRLESLPAIASASVMRSFPGKLSIRIVEREPLAWLQCERSGILAHRSDGGVLLDAEGIAFSPHHLQEQLMALPIIEVDDLAAVRAGAKITLPEVQQMLRLVDLSNEVFFDQRIPIKKVRPYGPYAMHVHYLAGCEVIYGRDDTADSEPLLRQIEDFGAVMAYAHENNRRLATLDLMVRDNRPATFLALHNQGDSEVLRAKPYGGAAESRQQDDLRAILGPLY